MTHIQVQNWKKKNTKKNMVVKPLKHTPVPESILFLIFLMYVKTIQHLNYSGQESKKQFAVYESQIPVTLKEGQGHQTWYELVDPKQDDNNVKFQKPCLNSVCEKASDKVFVKSVNMWVISLEYVQKFKKKEEKKVVYIYDLQSI